MCWTDLPGCQEGICLQRSHPFLCLPVGQGLSSCGAPDCVVIGPHLQRMQMHSLPCSHILYSSGSQAEGIPSRNIALMQAPAQSSRDIAPHVRKA